MSETKKLVALMLIVVFSLSLVACNPSAVSEPDNSTASPTDEATDSVAATLGESTTTVSGKTENNENTEKTDEMQGNVSSDSFYSVERTTNKDGNATDEFIKSIEGFTLKILFPWEDIYDNKKVQKAAKASINEVEKLYGVQIKEKSQYNNYYENLASELAAGTCENHIYYAKSGNFASYFHNGYIADLTDGMKESGVDMYEPWYVSDAKGFLNIDGKQYGWIGYEENFTMPYCIIYNKKLLNKKGLRDPAKLAEDGKWTWDTLKTYAKAFDNDKKITGFYGGGINMFAAIAEQYDTKLSKVSKGTQPTTNVNDSKLVDALAEYGEWVSSDDAFCEIFSDKSEEYAKKQLSKGKIAMYYGAFEDIKALEDSSTAKNIGIAPFPTKDESNTYTNISTPEYVSFIPITHQADAAKILFIRNEYYRYNYQYASKNLLYKLETYLGDNDEVITNMADIWFGREGNTTQFCWTALCESNDARVTTESLLTDIESEILDAESAVNNKRNALTASYAELWKGHRITGNV